MKFKSLDNNADRLNVADWNIWTPRNKKL